MQALVYHGPGAMAWEQAPNPVIVNDTGALKSSSPERDLSPQRLGVHARRIATHKEQTR